MSAIFSASFQEPARHHILLAKICRDLGPHQSLRLWELKVEQLCRRRRWQSFRFHGDINFRNYSTVNASTPKYLPDLVIINRRRGVVYGPHVGWLEGGVKMISWLELLFMTNLHLIFVVMKFSMLNAQFSNAQICISNFSLFFVSTFLLNKKKNSQFKKTRLLSWFS